MFYLDDIIVFSKMWEEHIRQAKLRLGASKCKLVAPQVSYLGHQVTKDSHLPDPPLLQAKGEIAPPQNVKEVKSFLGLASYYRHYAKGFAAIGLSLHALDFKMS